MHILNTSKALYADNNGKVFVKGFSVEAGQTAYLTLTLPKSANNRIEIPVYRVAGEVDCECEDHAGKKILPAHRIDGKEVFLGSHNDEAKHVAERLTIDWPGKYFIGTDMVAALNDPCQPVIVELHIEQRNQSVDPSA